MIHPLLSHVSGTLNIKTKRYFPVQKIWSRFKIESDYNSILLKIDSARYPIFSRFDKGSSPGNVSVITNDKTVSGDGLVI